MGRKNSWLDYIDLGRQRGNSYQQFSYLFGEINEIITTIIERSRRDSEKKGKKPKKGRIPSDYRDGLEGVAELPSEKETADAGNITGSAGEAQEISEPSGMTIVRQKAGRNQQGVILPADTDGRGVPGVLPGTEEERRRKLRSAVLWSEILGEPAAKKRHRKRVIQYYGNQGNADRGRSRDASAVEKNN